MNNSHALTVAAALLLSLPVASQGHKGGGGGGSPPPDPAIVFVERTSKNVSVRVMNSDGSNPRTVVTGGRYDNFRGPCWSPDGAHLAFSATLGGLQGLWVVDVSGAALQRLVPFSNTSPDVAHADWSRTGTPDGRDKIVFSVSTGGVDELYVVNPDGSGMQGLPLSAQEVWGVGWSHDATALVVTMGTDVVWLHLAAAGGGGLTVIGETWLPETHGAKGSPRCANTSDRIVNDCIWLGSPMIQGLQVRDPNLSPPSLTQVTNCGEIMGSFSPDDLRLAYRRNGSIYTCAADGSDEVLIRNGDSGPTSCNFPYWRRN